MGTCYKTYYKESDWIAEFRRQERKIREAFPGEQFKQCLDKDSFNMRYYNPMWVVTDHGNVWSLWKERPLKAYAEQQGVKNKDGEYPSVKYYYRNSCREAILKNGNQGMLRIFSHQLVANYFCDKTVINRYGEANVEVHHIFGYDETAENTEINNAEYIQYALKGDHILMNAIQNGTDLSKLESREGLKHQMTEKDPYDPYIQQILQQGRRTPGFQNGLKMIYHEDGTTDLQVIIGGRRTVDNTDQNL